MDHYEDKIRYICKKNFMWVEPQLAFIRALEVAGHTNPVFSIVECEANLAYASLHPMRIAMHTMDEEWTKEHGTPHHEFAYDVKEHVAEMCNFPGEWDRFGKLHMSPTDTIESYVLEIVEAVIAAGMGKPAICHVDGNIHLEWQSTWLSVELITDKRPTISDEAKLERMPPPPADLIDITQDWPGPAATRKTCDGPVKFTRIHREPRNE